MLTKQEIAANRAYLVRAARSFRLSRRMETTVPLQNYAHERALLLTIKDAAARLLESRR